MIRIELSNRAVMDALDDLQRRADNPRGVLALIGERLVESTQQRFATGTAPDGTPWAPNAQSTIEAFLRRKSSAYDKSGKRTGTKSGYYRKDGRIGAKGAAVVAGKRPLHGVSGALADQIYPQVIGNELIVGSAMKYAAMQQFGGAKAKFPNLWGDIPARPFLGISDEDERTIVDVIRDYLEGAIN